MINSSAIQIINDIGLLINLIQNDIEDLNSGDSDEMILRDEQKQLLVDQIRQTKNIMDQEILKCSNSGEDIEKYRPTIDGVESKLHDLNRKNSELAYILLPLKDMYDGIIEEFFKQNLSSVDFSA